jgi:hypothetical protein
VPKRTDRSPAKHQTIKVTQDRKNSSPPGYSRLKICFFFPDHETGKAKQMLHVHFSMTQRQLRTPRRIFAPLRVFEVML